MKAAIVIACMLVASAALADDGKARAVALFDEGIKEMKAGNFEKACASLRQSNELQADSGTRGSLARCYEKLGRVASAWKLWVDLSTTAPKNLRPDAAANAAKLEPRLPKYVVKVSPGTPPLSLAIDGEVVATKPGAAEVIDPGNHVLEANAAGYMGWKHEFTAVEGKTEEIVVPGLKRQVITDPVPGPGEPIEQLVEHKSSRKKIGLVVVGVGGALAITGTVFGVIARGRYNDAKDICGGDIDACDPARLADSQAKVDSARSAGNISTITMIAGGAALVTGVVLIVTAPKRKSGVAIVPAVGSDAAGFVVTGGF